MLIELQLSIDSINAVSICGARWHPRQRPYRNTDHEHREHRGPIPNVRTGNRGIAVYPGIDWCWCRCFKTSSKRPALTLMADVSIAGRFLGLVSQVSALYFFANLFLLHHDRTVRFRELTIDCGPSARNTICFAIIESNGCNQLDYGRASGSAHG